MNFVNGAFTLSLENNAPLVGPQPVEKIYGIYNLSRQLVSTNTLEVLLDSIVRQTVEILHVRFSRIMTMEPDASFICQAAYSVEGTGQARYRGRRAMSQAKTMYQQVVISEAPVMIEKGSSLPVEMRFALALNYTDSLYLIPLRVNQETVGVLVLGEEYHPMPETVIKEKIRLAVLIADQAASAIYRARLSYQLEESQLQTVMTLAKLIESRDAYVGSHCRKVTDLAVRLARKLDCSAPEVQSIRWAAMLHDIGKVGIRDEILNKKGSLSRDEWSAMRCHPETGAEIVRTAANLDFVASIILAHHERWDGNGYPYGLQKDLIPFGARILAVADAFGAMTDDRPYRSSCTLDDAIVELRRCSGTQFDPKVVDAFVAMIT